MGVCAACCIVSSFSFVSCWLRFSFSVDFGRHQEVDLELDSFFGGPAISSEEPDGGRA